MPAAVPDNVAVVLCRPRYPENIGAAARAMRNMGLHDLILVAPRNFDTERVYKMATHAAVDVARQAVVFDDLASALAPFQYVVGTTARFGSHRRTTSRPREVARRLAAMSAENRTALVFGPEDSGLTNDDVRLCHTLVTIPTADFSSLNLAQAVMILCYELFLALQEQRPEHVPRLATRHELDGMYAQLRDVLVRISYINPENPEYWLDRLRQSFSRVGLRGSDVSIIRGICRQIDWYAGKRYHDGLIAGGGPAEGSVSHSGKAVTKNKKN